MTRPPPPERADFTVFRPLTTRWMDNDVFGHVNNAHYYSFFDTAVTAFLHGRGLILRPDAPIWMVAETGCRFLSEVAFPEVLEIGLAVEALGTSSVRYRLGLFRDSAAVASAAGHLVHVHVDPATRRPCPMPDAVRTKLTL